MSILPPKKGRNPGRRPALRGSLMQDVSHGEERVRIWPRHRKRRPDKKQREAEAKFRAANMATKYIRPETLREFTDAVKGTPLLPRDLILMQLYQRLVGIITPDGRKLYPMPVKVDVSNALDAITQTPGKTIVRGEEFWEAGDAGSGGGWVQLLDYQIPGLIAPVEVDVSQYSYVTAIFSMVELNTPQVRTVGFSHDNGETWEPLTTGWNVIGADGFNTLGGQVINAHNGAARPERSGIVSFHTGEAGQPAIAQGLNRNTTFLGTYLKGRINRIRLGSPSGSAMQGGRLLVFAQ